MSSAVKTCARVSLLAAPALLLAGCGGGGSSDDAKAADAIAKSMVSTSSSQFRVTAKQADCVGKKMVALVGVDKLEHYGVLGKDLTANHNVDNVKMSRPDATNAATAISDCTDAAALMRKAVLGSQSLPASATACINTVLTDKVVHDLFVDVFAGDRAAAQTVVAGPVAQCVRKH